MNHIQRVLTGAALAVFCAAAFSCSNAFQDATGASSSGGGGKPTIRENQDPAFTIGSVIVNGSATVKPGGTAQYTATVTGTGTYSAAVTWSVTSSAGPLVGVTGISGGLLTVDGGEALDTVLTVKAVSAADVTKEGILPVTVSDYAISLSGSSDNFTSADFNYTNQSGNAITITVENTGAQPTGTLTAALDASTTTGNYILSPASLSGIPVGQSDTSSLTIYPGTGLDAGTYTAVVKVSGDHGISATVSLDFTVNKANMTGTLSVSAAANATGIGYSKTVNSFTPSPASSAVWYKKGDQTATVPTTITGLGTAGWTSRSDATGTVTGLAADDAGYTFVAVAAAATANYNDKISTPVLAPYSAVINLSTTRSADAWGCGWAYTHSTTLYTIKDGAAVTVQGTSANNRRLEVAGNATASITLNAATISLSGPESNSEAALLLNSGAEVTITLTGTSALRSGVACAGIQAPAGTTLTITSANGSSLNVQGDGGGAGIGGGYGGDGGTVIISGNAIVTATGGSTGAGIGGGYQGNGGNITISGNAQVTASGGDNGAAGIGGGQYGDGGDVTISGSGTVTATGGSQGAGIGGGDMGDGGEVKISGSGTVIADGGTGGAGIGGGGNGNGDGGTVTISGSGVVTANGGSNGAGIGGGAIGDGGTVTISGSGSVTATGGIAGAGIGGGSERGGGNITISGGTVTAIGGDWAGIGGGYDGGWGVSQGTVSISAGSYTWQANTTTSPGGATNTGPGTAYPPLSTSPAPDPAHKWVKIVCP